MFRSIWYLIILINGDGRKIVYMLENQGFGQRCLVQGIWYMLENQGFV